MLGGLTLGAPLQTAYVTTDLETACTLLGDRYGVTRYLRRGPVTISTDAGEGMTLDLAHAWIGPTWIEIIHPIGGAVAVYRDWLPAQGFGLRFHHLGFRIDDPERWREALDRAKGERDRFVFSMSDPALPSRVFYLDTTGDLGHYCEYLHFPDVSRSTMARMPQNLDGYTTRY